MAEASANNSWVDSYLDALLSYGLSSEYAGDKSKMPQSDKVDADRQVYAKYYVSQIMQLGEEGIQDAWSKATSARHYGEKDARLEYLSWRVWFMKRNKARVMAEEQKLQEDLAEEHQLDKLDKLDLTQEGVSDEEATPKASEQAQAEAFADGQMSPLPSDPSYASAPKPAKGPKSSRLQQGSASPPETPKSDALAPKTADPFENRVDGLYIVLISLHGLVRGDAMELGKDPDTGGQVKYVVELARALARHPAVYRVDLLTRLIEDPKVSPDYGQAEECIFKAEEGDLGGAYIVRLPCGPRHVYLRKEKLWPHIREFADNGIQHAKNMVIKLAKAHTPCELYAVHGHYADAGEVAALMSSTLGVEMAMTAHSLGRNKLEHLLASGTISKAEIESTYKISRRIEAEERALECASIVFTSTAQEIDEQWGLYDGFDKKLEAVLRTRRRMGRHMPCMVVIPPGLDFSNMKVDLPDDPAEAEMQSVKPAFASVTSPKATGKSLTPKGTSSGTTFTENGPGLKPLSRNMSGMGSKGMGSRRGSHGSLTTLDRDLLRRQVETQTSAAGVALAQFIKEDPPIWAEIARFLRNPRKPVILAMSRPDAKKNITTLVKAFGENNTLREIANLVLVMGNRENIDSMAAGSSKILTQVLKLVDSHDLYGSVAYPKKHSQMDISDIYRLPYATRGIFTNVALQEPFGLTVIEAAAHGVPTVATKNGGPVDIMQTLHHGILVDPTDSKAIADALLRILTNSSLWDEYSSNGVKHIMSYSWWSHCKKMLEVVEGEKRFQTSSKMDKRRLSGDWERAALGMPPKLRLPGSQGSDMNRLGSTPQLSGIPAIKPVNPTAARISRASMTDMPESPAGRSPRGSIGNVRLAHKQQLIIVQHDGGFRSESAFATLQQAVNASHASDGQTAVGIATLLGFEDACAEIKRVGMRLQDLDVVICHGGADIWQCKNSADGSTPSGWEADALWEDLIEWRWDRKQLQQVLTKLAESPTLISAPTTALLGNMSPLNKVLASPEQDKQRGIHPHHITLELDAEAKMMLGGGNTNGRQGAKGGAVSTSVVDRLRRRLRSNGYRAHLTLQMVPTEGEEHLLSRVHLTPVRASRSLALRFLANKFGLPMQNVTVVATPSQVTGKDGDMQQVSSYTSDLAELISGVVKVFVAMPEAPETGDLKKLDAGDATSLERLTIKVGSKLFGDRVQFVKAGSAVAEALQADSKMSRQNTSEPN